MHTESRRSRTFIFRKRVRFHVYAWNIVDILIIAAQPKNWRGRGWKGEGLVEKRGGGGRKKKESITKRVFTAWNNSLKFVITNASEGNVQLNCRVSFERNQSLFPLFFFSPPPPLRFPFFSLFLFPSPPSPPPLPLSPSAPGKFRATMREHNW